MYFLKLQSDWIYFLRRGGVIATSPVLVEVFNPIWSNCNLNPVQSNSLYINVEEAFTSTLFLNQLDVKLDFYVKMEEVKFVFDNNHIIRLLLLHIFVITLI